MTHKQRKPKRVNQYTGKPRKWTYGRSPHNFVDWELEVLELTTKARGWDSLPRAHRLAILKRYRVHAKAIVLIEESLERDGTLTASELRYCYLEGIEPEDYLSTRPTGLDGQASKAQSG